MADKTHPPLTLSREIAADDFAALSGLLLEALAVAARDGRTLAPASFGAEFTVSSFASSRINAIARVERATRTLVFVEGEASDPAGTRIAVASGVFKVIG